MEILRVEGLTVKNRKDNAILLKDISFSLNQGEILGILGESGSGKSLTSLAILGLLPSGLEVESGAIYYKGKNLLSLSPKEWEDIRGKEISIILQDPLTSLNPVLTIGEQIIEVLEAHLGMDKRSAWDRAIKLLSEVGIPEPELRMKSYPHQLSGGMRQRAMIAIALACDPTVLIADEPTTALDPTLQLQVLELLKELNQKRGLSIIFITHDLGVMRYIADRIVVYYKGEVVEDGETEKVFSKPTHPYTLSLLLSYPGSPLNATHA
jgi:ABC-type dipeptide/oligopeptide/nickel transport system ATPase component